MKKAIFAPPPFPRAVVSRRSHSFLCGTRLPRREIACAPPSPHIALATLAYAGLIRECLFETLHKHVSAAPRWCVRGPYSYRYATPDGVLGDKERRTKNIERRPKNREHRTGNRNRKSQLPKANRKPQIEKNTIFAPEMPGHIQF